MTGSNQSIFTFIDLFSGIGGFRIAGQRCNLECVFSSEIDKSASQTYFENFGSMPSGDITEIHSKDIPDHDILTAGFPCQAFSIAGKKEGFKDTRGTLFFDIARILKEKKPKAFLLENVKGLLSNNKGKTIQRIYQVLSEIGYYTLDPIVLNSTYFGVPQNRERVYLVGFIDESVRKKFKMPINHLRTNKSIKDILENDPVSNKFYLSENYLQTLISHKDRHSRKGNGFGFEIKSVNDYAATLVIGGMGLERNLIIDNKITDYTPVTNIKSPISKKNIRRLTPRECARLQGFPDDYKFPVSDSVAYKLIANSVTINVVEELLKRIISVI